MYKSYKQEPPQEILNQQIKVNKAFENLSSKAQNGELSETKYLELLEKSIQDDTKKLAELQGKPEQAQAFLDYLCSEEAKEAFTSYGFTCIAQ